MMANFADGFVKAGHLHDGAGLPCGHARALCRLAHFGRARPATSGGHLVLLSRLSGSRVASAAASFTGIVSPSATGARACVVTVLPSTFVAAVGLPRLPFFLRLPQKTDIGQLPVTPFQSEPGELRRCQIQQATKTEND